MRETMPLAGDWQFAPELDAPVVIAPPGAVEPPGGGWRTVQVPGHWQTQFRDLARATGVGWYRLRFALDETWSGADELAIEFGAVAHFCQVWLNGRYVGDHEGGHLPFWWSVASAAQLGDNELYVRVVSPSGDRSRYHEFPFEETLHGKQSWYGPLGGIWQEVRIERRSRHAISRLTLRADASNGTVAVRTELAEPAPSAQIRVSLVDPDGVEIATTNGRPGAEVLLGPPDASVHRWSPDTPVLYRVVAEVVVGGERCDAVGKRFGFRTFTSEGGRFVLNGRPLVMRGVLDQDYWDSPGVAGTEADIVERFIAVKQMGFNTLRCHIKVPDPRYLDVADELGLLVWCEMPTTSRLTPAARERIEETLAAMIDRDRHHPSVVVWGIANEAWGFDLLGSAEHREWLNELYRRTKRADPDRLVVDNSPCTPNFHVETDVEDYHFYAVLPEMRRRWERFLEEFAGRADFTFSPHGDAVRTGSEPLVVSEFGAWGLPDLSDLVDATGREPWWFETGQEWADGAAYVHGAPERFDLWHLDRVFGTWDGLCRETQRRQFETMRFQIDTMRCRSEIAGYVLTELSDVHWEANGLLDMVGRPRTFADRVATLNATPAVIAATDRSTVWDGDVVRVTVTAVNDDRPRPRAAVRCEPTVVGDEGGGTVATPLDALGSHRSPPFEITAACDGAPRLAPIGCSLESDGSTVAASELPVLVVPRLEPQLERQRGIHVDDERLAERLAAMGYDVGGDRSADFRVLRRLDSDDHDFVESGGTALLLAHDTDALGEGFGEYPRIELAAWRDALFGGGEWVSAFSWLRRSGRFADLPGGPMMDTYFEGLAPSVVIRNVPPARFEYDVLAGVFVGWVHQVSAIVARHHAGLGSLLISTLRLTGQPVGQHPLADWLLHQLVATAWEQQ